MADANEQLLTFDKLASGDRPSILALGVSGAESLKKTRIAVFAVDVLGRIQLLPPAAVQLLVPPRVKDDELDAMEEGRAIEVMLAQGDGEDVVITYLKARGAKENARGQQNV
jgi:hypothetical protein